MVGLPTNMVAQKIKGKKFSLHTRRLELSPKSDFQHSTIKLDNEGHPTIETVNV